MVHHARMTDGDARRMTAEPINSYQSAWLDHWKLSTGGSMSGPGKLATPDKCPEKTNLAVSTSFQSDKQLGPSSLLHGSKNKWPPTQLSMNQQGGISRPGPVTASKEHLKDARFCSSSSFSVYEKKTGGALEVGKLGSLVPERNYDHLVLHDPPTHVNLLRNVVGVEKVSGHSSIRMLPSREHHLGAGKLDEPCRQYFPLPKVPSSFHDVGTTPHTLLPRVHQFWLTRTADPKIYEVGNVQKESTISARFNGEMVGEFLCLSPGFGFPDKRRAKLQASGSCSTDDEAIRDVNHSVVLKNESSAETDTLEMDTFRKGHVSGVAFGSVNRNNIKVQHSSGTKTASPALASSVSDMEQSTSRTQSLDAEHLFAPAHQATTSKGAGVCNTSPAPGPSARWIKRLKLDTSDTLVHGTKSVEVSEASSHEKVSKMFGRNMKQTFSSSECAFRATDGKTHAAPDHASLLKKVSSSTTGSGIESLEINLSHFWIQRWCNNRVASSEKGRSEQQSSKATINEIENKLSPSIGAMALMGKALTGFHQCEIKRTGSLMVWNT